MPIGQAAVHGSAASLHAIDPSTGRELKPAYRAASADVDRACTLAQMAFDSYRDTTLEQRAKFLEQIAQNIIDLGPALIERAILGCRKRASKATARSPSAFRHTYEKTRAIPMRARAFCCLS